MLTLSVVFPQSLCWLLLTSGIRTALKDDAMQAGWAGRGSCMLGGMLWCWGMKAGDCSSLLDSAVRCRKRKNTGKVIRSVYMKMSFFYSCHSWKQQRTLVQISRKWNETGSGRDWIKMTCVDVSLKSCIFVSCNYIKNKHQPACYICSGVYLYIHAFI